MTDWSVDPEGWGAFLCGVWDTWFPHDVGRYFVNLFETAVKQSMGGNAILCVHHRFCGKNMTTLEHNGDVYPCDHLVYPEYRMGNIMTTPLVDMALSDRQREFGFYKGRSLPGQCRRCDYLNLCWGECPKTRFVRTPDGEMGLNYLCPGLKQFYSHIQRDLPVIIRAIDRWQPSASESLSRVDKRGESNSATGPSSERGPHVVDPKATNATNSGLSNKPEIVNAILEDGSLSISYRVSSATTRPAYPLTVRFFRSNGRSPVLIGSDTCLKEEAEATKNIQLIAADGLTAGDAIVAIATDSVGNSSEISSACLVKSPGAPSPNMEGCGEATDERVEPSSGGASEYVPDPFEASLAPSDQADAKEPAPISQLYSASLPPTLVDAVWISPADDDPLKNSNENGPSQVLEGQLADELALLADAVIRQRQHKA